jgi:glycosyltransferase involved in cell wall biosynthesis
MRSPTLLKRHRVLIVTPQPFYEDRGTPIAVQYVARALSELGAEVDLLAFPIGREVAIDNVNIRRCANLLGFRRIPIGFSWRKLVLDVSLWMSFTRLLSRRRYDMVHAVEEAAYIAAAICPRFGQPFIYDMASAIPVELERQPVLKFSRVQRLLAAVQRHVLTKAARVICSPGLGRYVHDQAPDASVTEWRFPAQLTRASAADARSLRERLGIAPNRRVILYSGSFAEYQGMDLLFDAFLCAREVNPELVLLCVGATEREMALWSKRISPELDPHVRLIARQPRERIGAFIELADFLALPRGRTANIPLKLFDYMASGKPIIATRMTAYEALLDRTRAFLCEPTVPSLTDAIVRACRSPVEAKSLASASRQFAERQFAWSRFVEFVRQAYAEAISPAAVPVPVPAPAVS